MINDRKNIDKLFADGLKTYKAQTPVHAWESLSSSLDKKQSRTKYLYVRLLAASVAILLAFGAGYFYANYDKQVPVLVKQEVPENLNSNEQFTNTDRNQVKQLEESVQVTELANEIIQEELKMDDGNSEITNTEKTSFTSSEITNNEKAIIAQTNSLDTRNKFDFSRLEMIPVNQLSISSSQTLTSVASSYYTFKPEISIPDFAGVEYTYGGGTDNQETVKNRWTLGAQFAPTYSYREISTNYENQGQINPDDNNYLNDNEEALMSYSGGLNVGFAVSNRWSLQSGMYYSRIGQVNNDALEYFDNGKNGVLYAVNTSTGSINISVERIPDHIRVISNVKDSSIVSGMVQIEQNFDFFEVPFLLKYKVLNRKFSVNLTGGLSPAYLVENNTYLKIEDEKYNIGDAANLNSLLVNTSIGLGLEYRFIKQLSLSFEPTFKYSLVSLNKDSQFYYHPYSLSWFTGIKFSF